MTDQGKPTIEELLVICELNMVALRARLSDGLVDRMAQERDALKAALDALREDICSALHAFENEGPRLAALRVMEEKQKAEAALAEQKPLVEAVMASDLKANGPAAREPGKAWCSGQSLKAILQAALAYREKQDKKEEGK